MVLRLTYTSISITYAAGMLAALLFSTVLAAEFSIAGMLFGFNLGLAIIFFYLIARVLSEYPSVPRHPFAFLRYFRTHWQIALSGFIYNLGIWVDKLPT